MVIAGGCTGHGHVVLPAGQLQYKNHCRWGIKKGNSNRYAETSITIWSRKKPNYCYSRSTSAKWLTRSTSAKWLTRSMMFMISGLRPTRQPGQPEQDWAPKMSCRRSSTQVFTNSSNTSCIPALTTCKRTQCNDFQTEAILLFFLEINLNQLLPCDGGEAVSLHLGKRRIVHNIFVHPKNNYSGRCV